MIVEDSSSKKVPLLYSMLFGLKKEIFQPKENPNIFEGYNKKHYKN